MARELYIDLKKSLRAIDQDVKEGMEAKAEQAGNLVHDRNEREAFHLVGELSGNRSGGHLQAVSVGERIFCGQQAMVKVVERVLNVNKDVDPAALRGIAVMLAASGPSQSPPLLAPPPSPPHPPPLHPAHNGCPRCSTRGHARSARAVASLVATAPPQPPPPPAGCAAGDELSLEEVRMAIQALRAGSASGDNGLATTLLKKGGPGATTLIHTAITAVWRSGEAPAEWKDACIHAIYKGCGSRTSMDTY